MVTVVPFTGSPPPPHAIPAAAAGGGENRAGLAEARAAIETNGHVNVNLNEDLNGDGGPVRASPSPLHEARGDEGAQRAQQESTTAGASSRNSSPALVARVGAREPQNTERLRRRVGEREDRLATQVGGCSPSGPVPSADGGDGFGGLRLAGMATAAVVVLSVAGALGSGDHRVREEGGQEIAGGVGEGTGNGWRLLLLVLLSASAAVAALMTVAAGCLWCAVRVARWREEIFAGSPVVAEVVARAEALDHHGSGEEHSAPPAEPWGRAGRSGIPATSSCGGNSVGDDPVGNMFRPGTRASHDFYAPDVTSATVAPATGAAAAFTVTEDENGAVVFMTGVTGLVGQMVLFDLLRQGAAAERLASADDDDNMDECWRGALASRGLCRVVVLVRRKKGVSPSDRLASIRDSPMFRHLRESGAWVDDEEAGTAAATEGPQGAPSPSSSAPRIAVSGLGLRRENGRKAGTVVTAVEGELGKEGLGLTAEARALLAGAGVTHALHCAASVSFSDPLAEAAATNVTGALRVAALVASWPSCG